MELKGIPSIQNYKEVSTIAQFRLAGFPTDGPENVCLEGDRLRILQEFNSYSNGSNTWSPLQPWGSDIYYESSVSTLDTDWSFLSENLDNQTIADGTRLLNTSGILSCNSGNSEWSQGGNSFCQ